MLVQNVLFINPAYAICVQDCFKQIFTQHGLQQTSSLVQVTFVLSPHCCHNPHDHNTSHLCWTCHVWQAQCLQMCKNWSWQPSQLLFIFSLSGRHYVCALWQTTHKFYIL